jgi:putative copper resistance protein D
VLTSAYGQALLTKILLVAGLLGLAARNRFRIVPALRAGDLTAALRLRRSIDLEVMLALAILVVSSLLTSSLTLPTMEMGQ